MVKARERLTLVEYGSPVDLSTKIIDVIGGSRTKADSLLLEAGRRVASSLKMDYNPISVEARGVRAINFAGLIRLNPLLELEVSPKFLRPEDDDNSWREDFFFLSTLSRHGHLLVSEHLSASSGKPRDLVTLVARSLVGMYEGLKRRPLRGYRKTKETDFFIEGDPDPMDLVFPSPDGFEQEVIRFDRRNQWNSDIVAAAKELLPDISNPLVMSSLLRMIEELSPQNTPNGRRKPIPARHRGWIPLHELSVDVLAGFGLNYKKGQTHAPGYLVSTWQIWENLLMVGIRLSFGRSAMLSQKGFVLGTKTKKNLEHKKENLWVFPDCVIKDDEANLLMIIDAKYKGHVEKEQLRITEADIYEALAFSRATGINFVVLAYPAQPIINPPPVGTCTVFEKIDVDGVRLIGVQIESRLISKPRGLRDFSKNLEKEIRNLWSNPLD